MKPTAKTKPINDGGVFARDVSGETLYREAKVKSDAVDEEARTVELAFSSEEPVSRWWGIEVLDHDPSSVDLSRLNNAGPLLMDHNPADHVGVIESAQIDNDRTGRAVVKISRSVRGAEVLQDIVDGIRNSVSVGYRVNKAVLEESGDDGDDRYRVVSWTPVEISLVSIPADDTVGVGRSAPSEKGEHPVITSLEVSEMTEKTESKSAPAVDLDAVREEAREAERVRVSRITKIGGKFGADDLARDFIGSGGSVDEFADALAERGAPAPKAPEAKDTPASEIGMTEGEAREFSVMRAIRAAASGDWSKAGFEREASLAVADALGREARGFFIPAEVQQRMSVGNDAQGGYLVGTEHRPGDFIGMLRARSVATGLGARIMSGLTGNVDIPKQTSAAVFAWLGEDEEVSNSEIGTGSLVLTPRTVAGAVPMTRRLLKQASPDAEALVLADLAAGAALAIDNAVVNGTGANGQPLGIVNTTGVNTQSVASAGDPTWAEVVGFESAVDSDNALGGSLAYLTTPAVAGAMKVKAKDAGSGLFVMSDSGNVNGYRCEKSTQVAANGLIFGDFSSVVIGEWGVLDILPDNAAKAASGGLVLRAFMDVDVGVRHAESFCINA